MQRLLKSVLQLESQTELIDYTKKNFVHADLSPEQMMEAMKVRGEDGWTLALGIAADMLRQQNVAAKKKPEKPAAKEEDIDIFSLFSDPQGPMKLKRLMAGQFEAMEAPGGGLGQTLNTVLITDRNAAAMKAPAEGDRQGQEEDRHLLRRRPHARLRETPARRLRPET